MVMIILERLQVFRLFIFCASSTICTGCSRQYSAVHTYYVFIHMIIILLASESRPYYIHCVYVYKVYNIMDFHNIYFNWVNMDIKAVVHS